MKSKKEENTSIKEIIHEKYHLLIPKTPKKVMIVIPAYQQSIEDVKKEVDFTEIIQQQEIAIFYIKNDERIETDDDKFKIGALIQNTLERYELPTHQVYMLGMEDGAEGGRTVVAYCTNMKRLYFSTQKSVQLYQNQREKNQRLMKTLFE